MCHKNCTRVLENLNFSEDNFVVLRGDRLQLHLGGLSAVPYALFASTPHDFDIAHRDFGCLALHRH